MYIAGCLTTQNFPPPIAAQYRETRKALFGIPAEAAKSVPLRGKLLNLASEYDSSQRERIPQAAATEGARLILERATPVFSQSKQRGQPPPYVGCDEIVKGLD
jgi:hypothetical protein